MMGQQNAPFVDASECVAASSLGDLHVAVPAPAAAAAVVVSCGCMDMHSLYRLSFELVLVWTCMNYQWCLMDLYRLHLGLYALRYLHLDFYGLNVM